MSKKNKRKRTEDQEDLYAPVLILIPFDAANGLEMLRSIYESGAGDKVIHDVAEHVKEHFKPTKVYTQAVTEKKIREEVDAAVKVILQIREVLGKRKGANVEVYDNIPVKKEETP